MRKFKHNVSGALVIGIALLIPTITARAQQKEVYTGNVIGVGGRMGGVVRPFTLTIEGRSSPAATRRAVALLAEGGQDSLLSEIRKNELGRFSMGAQLGRDLNLVQETATPGGGRRIIILFERWLNLFEVRNGTRSEDYPFTYIELTVDSSGKGAGMMIPAARIRFDKKAGDQIEVENFGIYPARLVNVQRKN